MRWDANPFRIMDGYEALRARSLRADGLVAPVASALVVALAVVPVIW